MVLQELQLIGKLLGCSARCDQVPARDAGRHVVAALVGEQRTAAEVHQAPFVVLAVGEVGDDVMLVGLGARCHTAVPRQEVLFAVDRGGVRDEDLLHEGQDGKPKQRP